jgi:hypothetical protein
MPKLCQILQRRPPKRGDPERPRWQFAAHGAAWNEEEAESHIALLERHGWQVKRIKLHRNARAGRSERMGARLAVLR